MTLENVFYENSFYQINRSPKFIHYIKYECTVEQKYGPRALSE